MERPTVLETEWDVRSVIRKEALSQMNTSDNEGAGALESQRGMPSIKELVMASCEETPQPLDVAYSFVRAWRGQEIAEETIRARMYEALKEGKIIRVARGVYFARSGTAQLVLFEGDAWEAMPKVADDSVDCIITDHPFKLGTDKWVGMGTTRPHAKMGERTYAQRDIDEEWLRNAFRILRKDKAWNTINKERKLAGDWPVGGGACLLPVRLFGHGPRIVLRIRSVFSQAAKPQSVVAHDWLHTTRGLCCQAAAAPRVQRTAEHPFYVVRLSKKLTRCPTIRRK